jgi:hypothetical protein
MYLAGLYAKPRLSEVARWYKATGLAYGVACMTMTNMVAAITSPAALSMQPGLVPQEIYSDRGG